MADSFVLEIPEQVGLAVATERKPQARTRDWPAGTRIGITLAVDKAIAFRAAADAGIPSGHA